MKGLIFTALLGLAAWAGAASVRMSNTANLNLVGGQYVKVCIVSEDGQEQVLFSDKVFPGFTAKGQVTYTLSMTEL
jgi:hypothetical protein